MIKEMVLISLLLILLPFVSGERYIIEVNEDFDEDSTRLEIVEVVHESFEVSGQVAGASLSFKEPKRIVVNIQEENEIEELDGKGILRYEKDYEIKALAVETPWHYELIGLDFENVDLMNDFGEGVKVAVLDSGVDFSLLDVEKGPDFVNGDLSPDDDFGHGTLTTQLLRNPGTNLPLVESEVYAVKVLDDEGSGFVSDTISAIFWAIDNDIDIVLMSFGGPDFSTFFDEVSSFAYSNGVLLIAAVGNEASSDSIYPAGFSSVIGAGSVNSGLDKSSFSNTGESVELMAPGEGILVTDGTFEFIVSGTSFSVPHIGIVSSYHMSNRMSNQETRNLLHMTALDLGEEGKDDTYGWGLTRIKKVGASDGNLADRVSVLELWRNLVEGIIDDILLSISRLSMDVDELDSRVESIESKNLTFGNVSFPNYFKHMTSSDRKRMVCGYAEENRLTHYEDLGWECDLTYRVSRSGRESVRCRCDRV